MLTEVHCNVAMLSNAYAVLFETIASQSLWSCAGENHICITDKYSPPASLLYSSLSHQNTPLQVLDNILHGKRLQSSGHTQPGQAYMLEPVSQGDQAPDILKASNLHLTSVHIVQELAQDPLLHIQ